MITRGLFPKGESNPPSKLNPNPALSLTSVTHIGADLSVGEGGDFSTGGVVSTLVLTTELVIDFEETLVLTPFVGDVEKTSSFLRDMTKVTSGLGA